MIEPFPIVAVRKGDRVKNLPAHFTGWGHATVTRTSRIGECGTWVQRETWNLEPVPFGTSRHEIDAVRL